MAYTESATRRTRRPPSPAIGPSHPAAAESPGRRGRSGPSVVVDRLVPERHDVVDRREVEGGREAAHGELAWVVEHLRRCQVADRPPIGADRDHARHGGSQAVPLEAPGATEPVGELDHLEALDADLFPLVGRPRVDLDPRVADPFRGLHDLELAEQVADLAGSEDM